MLVFITGAMGWSIQSKENIEGHAQTKKQGMVTFIHCISIYAASRGNGPS